MAFDQTSDATSSSSDRVFERQNINQAMQWQGNSWRQALDTMQPQDTGSQHLPNFSIENSGSGSITFNIDIASQSADKNSQLDNSIKTFESDLHTLERDVSVLEKQLAGLFQPPGTPPAQGGGDTPIPISSGGTDNPPPPANNGGIDTPPPPANNGGGDTPAQPANNGGIDTPAQPANNGTDKPASPGDNSTKPPIPTGPVDSGQWMQQTVNGMKYDVLLPANYDPTKKYPTVLYMHQLDMGTDEPDLLNEVNPWFNSSQYRTNNPSIVVMPLLDQSADPSGQTVNFGGVSQGDQPGQDNAIAALKQVEAQYSVDSSRVYVTGNSLGGIGTWDMLTKYNAVNGTQGRIFAAGMPLAGNDYAAGGANPDPAVVDQLKNVPIWAIHGADDQQVPNSWDRALAQSLSNDPSFKYTELQAGHDVWDTVYPDQSYWTWLFSQQSSV